MRTSWKGRRGWMTMLVWVLASASQGVGCAPVWPSSQDLSETAGGQDVASPGAADSPGAVPPPCRPAGTGELVINEVVSRPGGLDLDHDGASNGHDELVELVSRADEPVHLIGASLWWKGERRGGFLFSPCIQPRTAAVVSTTGAGNLKLPAGALEVQLDRTLRLSDGGGSLEIRGIKGTPLDAVDVPAAVTPNAPAVWSRARDGDWHTSLRSHNEVVGATRPASLGRCANAARFPCCLGWLDAYIEKGRYSE